MRSESDTYKYRIKQIKTVAANKTETILRTNKKNFQDTEFSHEQDKQLKKKNAFANNTPTDINLVKLKYLK